MRKVTILGAGSWGTALSTLLGKADEVYLWEKFPDIAMDFQNARENRYFLPGIPLLKNATVCSSLEMALRGSDAVVFAVPSGAMAEVVGIAAPYIGNTTLLINASKGLECETCRRMSEVISDVLSRETSESKASISERLVSISGPNLAVEIGRGLPSACVAASSNPISAALCQELWMGPTFRVYTSTDIVGVELAGAMKNVIAIGAGICEGAGFGDNSKAALMTRGLAEITRLGVELGAERPTFLGLAGVGDLIATCGSKLSRNYRVGYGLSQHKKLDDILKEIGQTAEGVPTTMAICALAVRKKVEMPISQTLYSTLFEGLLIPDALEQLMLRPPRSERA